jgi:hypothetical protein
MTAFPDSALIPDPERRALASIFESADGLQDRASGGALGLFPSATEVIRRSPSLRKNADGPLPRFRPSPVPAASRKVRDVPHPNSPPTLRSRPIGESRTCCARKHVARHEQTPLTPLTLRDTGSGKRIGTQRQREPRKQRKPVYALFLCSPCSLCVIPDIGIRCALQQRISRGDAEENGEPRRTHRSSSAAHLFPPRPPRDPF